MKKLLIAVAFLMTSTTAYSQDITTLIDDALTSGQKFIEKIEPFAELLDSIGPYVTAYDPPWGDSLQEIAKEQSDTLEQILKSFEQGNPAKLSDELDYGFIPVFKRSRKLFKDEIIPYLKKRVEEAKA